MCEETPISTRHRDISHTEVRTTLNELVADISVIVTNTYTAS